MDVKESRTTKKFFSDKEMTRLFIKKKKIRLFIKNELQDLLNYHPDQYLWDTPGRELIRLYRLVNSERKGRQGNFKKGPFALYWITRILGDVSKLESFLNWLCQNDKKLHEKLFKKEFPELTKTIYRYRKRNIVDRALRMDSSLAYRKIIKKFGEPLEDRESSIKNLPLFARLPTKGPILTRKIEKDWRQIRKDDRLTGGVFRFIQSNMKQKDDWIKIRALQTRFTKTKAELAFILQRLVDHRLILWDQEKSRVQINSYNPRDRRKFVWLAASSWPRSPFEPYLEKDKEYEVRDFRVHVVEEWVRQGAAKFV